MHDNIKIANIAIDKRNLNNLKEAINTIKKGNKTLIDTIGSGRLKDEKGNPLGGRVRKEGRSHGA